MAKVKKAVKEKDSKVAKKESKDDKYESGGIAFVGFLMIGLAAGIYTGHTAVGVLAGLGIGFVAMAMLSRNK